MLGTLRRITTVLTVMYNEKLQQYFKRAEPIVSLLLIDPKARWNQELENVFLIKCENRDDYQHYEYELRPDCL